MSNKRDNLQCKTPLEGVQSNYDDLRDAMKSLRNELKKMSKESNTMVFVARIYHDIAQAIDKTIRKIS